MKMGLRSIAGASHLSARILLPPAMSDGAFSRLLNLSTSEMNCKFPTLSMACVCMPRLRSRQVSRINAMMMEMVTSVNFGNNAVLFGETASVRNSSIILYLLQNILKQITRRWRHNLAKGCPNQGFERQPTL